MSRSRPTFGRPKSFQIGELFKIEKGRIRQIEAVLLDVPYGMKSGWGKSAGTRPCRTAAGAGRLRSRLSGRLRGQVPGGAAAP